MPAKSKAEMRFLFANKPEIAKEFAVSGKAYKKLPEHVKKTASGKGKKK